MGKPVAQLALVQAIVRLRSEDDSGRRISMEEVCRRINKLDWSSDAAVWQHVLMNGERVVTGTTAARFAAQVISYWLGEKLDNVAEQKLKERYAELSDGKELPVPLF